MKSGFELEASSAASVRDSILPDSSVIRQPEVSGARFAARQTGSGYDARAAVE